MMTDKELQNHALAERYRAEVHAERDLDASQDTEKQPSAGQKEEEIPASEALS